MFIDVYMDERCETELCSFTSMDPPDIFTREELIGAYYLAPDSVQIK